MRVGVASVEQEYWPKMRWVAEAFRRIGHQCVEVGDLSSLSLADESCELVIFRQKSAGLNDVDLVRMSRGRKAVWVTWVFDLMAPIPNLPLAEQPTLRTQTLDGWNDAPTLATMKACDLCFVKERGLLDEYRALGIEPRWLDQGCPSWLEACEHREIPEWDALLWGSFGEEYEQRRHDATVLATEGFVVAWAGRPGGAPPPPGCLALPWCPADKLPELASRAAVTVGSDSRSDLDGYWSDRLWIACGMGSCHLRRQSPGLPDGPYRVYGSDDELLAQVQELRRDRALRDEIGTAARAWVMREHTYERRCEKLLSEVERWRSARESVGPATV